MMGFFKIDTRTIKDLSDNYAGKLSDSDFKRLRREAYNWLSTNDPDYLYAAVMIIRKADLQLKGFLYEQYLDLAEKTLKGEVIKNIRRDEHRKILARNKDFFREDLILKIVFELNEFCGVKIVDACDLAAAIHEGRYHKTGLSAKTIYASTAKKKYQGWKKDKGFKLEGSPNYAFLKGCLNEYRQELYPNMSDAEIKESIVGDLDIDKYEYLFIDKE
ncbi:hypothetical protein GL177_10555 [Vibrio toranzoniae]|uniref:hypothetical protein n=1 Tax=Vibrio toranzoniae TaxID=1194427 RepID=UPI0013786A4A|nr:hypothetical protein [Vibrio toranzoniae]NAZ53784.1 hypothetical protein [Vibrio toranzoniae]